MNETRQLRAIGLMSGTSMDGVDVAMIDTDGETRITFGPTGGLPYTAEQRNLLRDGLEAARHLVDRTHRPGALEAAERMVTDVHAQAVEQFLSANRIARDGVDLIGFHGQTVLHRPEQRLTVQIGDGAALAQRLGIPIVADMRADDVARGGQGAPLVPVFHRALAQATGLPRPLLVINIGGVGNITFVQDGVDPIACDTGPGNALLDDLMLERTGRAIDHDGTTASSGQIDPQALALLLDHSYFALPLPKSLDRNAFSRQAVAHLSTADAAATLVAFTAGSITACLALLPDVPALAVVCGGGAHNEALMQALRAAFPCALKRAADVGWVGDAIEAQAFAYLAVRSRRGLPLTFPTTTGVDAPLSGGRFHAARRLTS